jgi:hypothetical protein
MPHFSFGPAIAPHRVPTQQRFGRLPPLGHVRKNSGSLDWRWPVLGGTGLGAAATIVAVTAATHQMMNSRGVRALSFAGSTIYVSRLRSLRADAEALETLENALRAEWGTFGLLGFSSIEEMRNACGKMVFVAYRQGDNGVTPVAILQTTLLDVAGDAGRLAARHPSFLDLTSKASLRDAQLIGGDTAVLLQITVIDEGLRRGGLGSLLRDTALTMLDRSVDYALTTTPIDVNPGGTEPSFDDPSTFTSAMRFHARGGAVPVLRLSGYKTDPTGESPRHSTDVVAMRYERNAEGQWPMVRPRNLHAGQWKFGPDVSAARRHAVDQIEHGLDASRSALARALQVAGGAVPRPRRSETAEDKIRGVPKLRPFVH